MFLREVRSTNVSTSQSIQTAIAFSRISARVSSSTKAPPPVAMTPLPSSIRRAITLRSPSRKYASPNSSKISPTLRWAASSIALSASTKSRFSRSESLRPTVDLPTPISPTSTIGRSIAWAWLTICAQASGLDISVIAQPAINGVERCAICLLKMKQMPPLGKLRKKIGIGG